ncbi:tetratricopeptide repeat protein [Neobacillus sp. LXY-1]|uniref:tetratricopeptide repeat protein n=1 Tax=Neobacillus sp. LXY-1 TaxID=3379133 RepID=UPI003EE0071F
MSKQGKYEEAIQLFFQADQVMPANDTIYYNIANTYAEMDYHDEAIKFFDKALSIKPDVPHVIYNKANSFAKKGMANELHIKFNETAGHTIMGISDFIRYNHENFLKIED